MSPDGFVSGRRASHRKDTASGVAGEDWVDVAVTSRLVLVMRAFPGLTPVQVWALSWVEWLVVAAGAHQWAEAQEQARRDAERRR